MDTRAESLPILTSTDLADLTAWRHLLHRHPELSGQEVETAARVVAMLQPTQPDHILTGLGGHGVAAVFDSGAPGPSVMLRCELDALPITEINDTLPHRSTLPGKAHLCGHDGHMAIVIATARWLGRNRPQKGRVILLFQPAEEDGSGAQKVILDPRFDLILPDFAFALHNFPGIALGQAVLSAGPANCASRGMKITLKGRTAHASQPETGTSPAAALASLIETLSALGTGGDTRRADYALVTVTHARLGEEGFGTSPGDADLHVTLRTQKDHGMATLMQQAEDCVTRAAAHGGLLCAISYHDIFRHCENAPEAVQILHDALSAEGIPVAPAPGPLRGSEDFGRFNDHAPCAMVLLGSGHDTANLHNPDFDFPDRLIPIGAAVFVRVIKILCNT
jgi:amidohydrolase